MTATTRGSPVGGNDSQGQAPDGQSQPPLQQNQTSSPDSSNENSPATPPDEQGQGDAPPQLEDEEPAFPHTDLAKLDDMINRPRWVVPVLPKGELEVLLEAAIDLSKKGLDVKSEACQRFFRDGLTISFTKILTDEARCIINNTHRLVELCVAKLSQDWFPLLELLSMALNPHCKFHIYNGTRPCESVSSNVQLPEDELFARSPDPRSPKGWLVDLLNKFGTLNGFQILHDRFINGSALNVQIIAALIKPFGQCYEFLTLHTVKKYFLPVIEMVPQFLENLTDEELKKEAKNEAKNDALSMIIKSLKNLASRVPGQEETVKNLEIFRLKMILRLLQISSFNGKMNALNEVNKVISSVSYYTHRHGNPEEEEWLTAERMAEWIQQNNILSIVLRDSLHQPQYVEKLEKILRFVIKEKALTLQDLDNIWAAQAGKHEAIVKNVHDLLAKLAWDFSPEQLDHLFDCFKASWTNASKKQREKLLELIRRLAEDDKDGVMAHKVLNLLWNLAHSDDVPVDIMDLALSAHIKILDYSCSQVVIQSNDDIASRAIDLLKEIYTNLGPRLQVNQVVIHEDFIQSCFDRLKASYDTLCVLDGDKDSINCARQEAVRMVRVLTVLREYINECDSDYHEERTILPMSRAFRGKHLSFIVRFPNQGRQVDDLDVWSHTNDTIGSVRRCILNRIKANVAHTKIELFVGGELIDPADDRKLIGQLNLKDKSLITAKLTQISSNMPSSPDSSSDSSTGSPGNHGNHYSDGPNPEVESCLPGVIMSLHPRYISFLWQVADLGSSLNMPPLRDGARVLMKLMPPDSTTIEKLRAICLDHAKLGESSLSPSLDSLFFGPSASQVLYLTEVVYALLMPAGAPLADDSSDFQFHFLKSGGLPLVLSMLTRNNFLPNADMETRRGAYLNALKIAKLLLTAIGYGHVRAVAEACQPGVEGVNPMASVNQVTHDQAVVLQSALQSIPNPSSECMLRNVSIRLAQQISDETNAGCDPDLEDEQVCCEALEVMTLCFALIPTALDALSKEKAWQTFIIDLLLHCHSKTVRQVAQEQFFLMCTRCCMGHRPLLFFITLLFTVLGSTARERAKHSGDYFTLLRHLLNYAYNSNINIPNAEVLLNNEIDWLKRIRDDVKRTGETGVEETILEGHLGVTKELLAFQTPEKKYHIGCEKGGANLIKELIDDFIFPASNVYLQYMRNGELPAEQAIPVCSSPATINAGFELLVALAVGCVRNLKQIVDSLTEMYYIGTAITTCEALTEWEYLPPVGPRPPKGFVGLKNAGATCYMNSVIQQLYMIPSIRNGILAIEGTGGDVDDDMSGDEKQDNESNVDPRDDVFGYPQQFEDKPALSKTEDRKEYNIGVLRHLQVIFGHLAASRLQYYVPRGFWKQFRYECEESFTTLNVDIRNHQNLLDSLEQYVKGDLLEGANAYHCEKCNKKVDTVKRLLIKKLPPVLAIQLKRFDYDWERECAIKFNDYFEFPRELDMEPYTVAGVAKLEGDNVNPESQLIQQNEQSDSETAGSTKYRLVGVLVHSGQASGGHYYSYIIQRNGGDGERNRWYKFDDGDVTECKMDDDEEMKNQCFGGEYMGEVFDHMMKRMSYRRQKRWWNAYILFYERLDTIDQGDELIRYISELAITTRPHQIIMPSAIERSVRKQNVQFMHNRMQYSMEYFQFMKKLLTCNGVYLNPPPGVAEKTQLLKLSVPATFMLVSLDEGPGPPIKYQYAELGKLYSVVSQLIRCCNVSSRMQSSINGNPPLPNPFGDPNLSQPIMPIQQNVADILFVRTSYVKKIIEDCSNSEETVKLLRFCCWENPQFSSTVLSELLWQVAYSYTYELRPYLDLLLQILLIEDSWQTHRIHNALKGIPDDRDGLFDTIQRSKNHYQKRAYQCIKCMVALFSNCPVAYQILQVGPGEGSVQNEGSEPPSPQTCLNTACTAARSEGQHLQGAKETGKQLLEAVFKIRKLDGDCLKLGCINRKQKKEQILVFEL
ncbi:putative ubiquitin carboxyl-terminal hydrolase FAF-X isoform 1 [Camelus ferus]|nr:putative ubiquitin carboxyl-terminal hydrolase FAF-X isoform 1 [Camelus ferus]